jgi:hypothetical protein
MPAKIQASYTRANRHRIVCLGDSLTGAYYLGLRMDQMWPEALAAKLRAQGCLVQARNWGIGGNKSIDALARAAVTGTYEVPDAVFLWIGVNDPVLTAAALAQGGAGNVDVGAHDYSVTYVGSFSGVTGESPPGKHGTITVATSASQVNLTAIPTGPTGTTSRKIYRSKAGTTTPLYLVTTLGDSTTTTYTDNTADASLGAVQASPYLTELLIRAMIDSWVAAGVSRIMCLTVEYMNVNGGDTPSTPYVPFSGINPAVSGAVTNRQAAYPAASIVLCDLYSYLRNIVANSPAGNNVVTFGGVTYTIAQGDAQWHVASSDQHYNALGQELVARAVMAAVPNAWLTALKVP